MLSSRRLLMLAGLVALLLPALLAAAPKRGAKAPEFTLETLDGERIALSDYRGTSAVLLNFYANFCPSCHEECPAPAEDRRDLSRPRPSGPLIPLEEERAAAAVFPLKFKVKFPILLDPTMKIAEAYGVSSIPHNVFIDRDGRVAKVVIGFDSKDLEKTAAAMARKG